ncbi:PIG-L family deacetylase [Acidithiobacillus montserratensis]|uniref:PIG-L family deacetylase n=1 Tax=Acidithiobacillus montserratensis TaxID=2729135 RepID=A0ACD5HJJ0_9PROT|nr:PIG-L family deacetylase [Acidithiobacillus montserratensis]MBN2679564.1 PIG-L family deacetylase [Acidithiobacillaceae bacterium]MBU2746941.1 PIG-L family deacetylase [Acidithiobacillus montserratensis]
MNVKESCYLAPPERLPTPSPLTYSGWQNVILLIPHADDEAIGCGGLIAALGEANITLHVILVSDSSGGVDPALGISAIRQHEFIASLKLLHPKATYTFWALPDGQLSAHISTILAKIDDLLTNHPADTLLAPWPMDMHPDHSALGYTISNAVAINPRMLKRLCFYEVWSPVPANRVLDISAWWQKKENAIQCHKTALTYGGSYDRAIRGLAEYRSLLTSHMAKEGSYAEAYCMQNIQDVENDVQ